MLVECFVGQGELWRALLGNKDQCVHFLSVVCNLFSPDDVECVRVQPWRVLMLPAVAVTSFSPDGAGVDHLHKTPPALCSQIKRTVLRQCKVRGFECRTLKTPHYTLGQNSPFYLIKRRVLPQCIVRDFEGPAQLSLKKSEV